MLPQWATKRRTDSGKGAAVLSPISVMTEITALTDAAVKRGALGQIDHWRLSGSRGILCSRKMAMQTSSSRGIERIAASRVRVRAFCVQGKIYESNLPAADILQSSKCLHSPRHLHSLMSAG